MPSIFQILNTAEMLKISVMCLTCMLWGGSRLASIRDINVSLASASEKVMDLRRLTSLPYSGKKRIP